MEALKKPVGAYLVLLAIVVAAYFIANPLLVDAIDVPQVWSILDYFMAVGVVLGLLYAYLGKRAVDAEDGVTREYVEANVTFFVVAAVAVLFLHNWFSLLQFGLDDGNHQAWVIWAFVDTALPLSLGILGCRLLRGA